MKIIPLTKGYITVVDDCDFDRLSEWNWHVVLTKRSAYAARSSHAGGRRLIFMHREILHSGESQEVDHADGQGLNNCRKNLRGCLTIQNKQNRRLPVNNTSGFKGLVEQPSGRWRANIGAGGKKVHLGMFSTRIEAALAYDSAAKKLHKEFSRTNF